MVTYMYMLSFCINHVVLLILDSVGFKIADYAKIKRYIHFIRLFALSDKFGIDVAINDFLPKSIENRHCV